MRRSANQYLKNIPGTAWSPIVGNLPQLLPDPLPYVQCLQKIHGNVFYARFELNRKSVFMLGPELTELVLMNRQEMFSNELGYLGQSKYLGEGGVMFQDGARHKTLRRGLNTAFKPRRLESYLDTMNTNIAEYVARWVEVSDVVDINEDLRHLALNIASNTIAGASLGNDTAHINTNFSGLIAAMAKAGPCLPGTAKWRALKQRAWLDDYFRSQISARLKGDGGDLFSNICRSAVEENLSEDDVVDNMIGMMAAAFETTASTLSFMLYALAKHPLWQDRLRAELFGLGTDGEIGYDELSSCVQTEWFFKECLRLYTPISFLPRRTIAPVLVEGLEIPSNTSVIVAPNFVHKMASVYPQPELFDPERFAPGRAEDKAHACAWVPFSKGAHTCMGMHFARMESFAFLYQVLGKLRIELIPEMTLSTRHVPIFQPSGKLPVRLARL